MGVVAFGSVRSCGLTTSLLGLAKTWPEPERLLVLEADPSGGSLAAMLAVTGESGLVALAAQTRRRDSAASLDDHAVVLPEGARVLTGPAGADQMRASLTALRGWLQRLGSLGLAVLVDCGRLTPGTVGWEIWQRADHRLLFTRPALPDLHSLDVWTKTHLAEASAELVLVGGGPYSSTEVSNALGLNVVGALPGDPAGAEALTCPTGTRKTRTTPFARAAQALATTLKERTSEPAMPPGAIDLRTSEAPAELPLPTSGTEHSPLVEATP